MVREEGKAGGRVGVRKGGRSTDEMLRELGRTVPGSRRNIINTEVSGGVWCVVCGGEWCVVSGVRSYH